MSHTSRLYIAPHTRLETVWRHVDDAGIVSYQVWTSCRNRDAPFEQMMGTFMNLEHNGAVTRVTLRPDDSVHVFDVMPQIGED